MSMPVRAVLLAVVVTLAIASCSGSHKGDKTSWRANSSHGPRSRGR